jgi:hypothetical protein
MEQTIGFHATACLARGPEYTHGKSGSEADISDGKISKTTFIMSILEKYKKGPYYLSMPPELQAYLS